jgi:drug/metabolite transporter (DMT)-like permease
MRITLFAAIVVCGDLLGNVLLRTGMRGPSAVPATDPIVYLAALLNPFVLFGVVLMIGSLGAQLALLSWADLSYVVPVTSVGYVLNALAGNLFLHEPLSIVRWAAILLIMGGVTLVARTPRSTTGSGVSQ